ncbi:uncharacterized protein YbbC (DUF1343 family) [Winogradskyella epiphytica]|uniref:Uncharacterized protein YbbC (DUF1343 family) n=1 Tax=Winogradskyella epiphytica TaxID=262005 RepID=A0A2V4X4Z0_9FLAO|nr:DUF1343 domain-containing protein [Winogradskyella epiphytica]PYE80105.1 uncharacterized protein YbbC (DUF1343 family) [Winogradskyella epiphytica]
MLLKVVKNTVLFSIIIGLNLLTFSCGNKVKSEAGSSKDKVLMNENTSQSINSTLNRQKTISVGANRTALYLPLLQGKRVGIVANQTSVIFKDQAKHNSNYSTHIVDSLLSLNVDVKRVFAPEHGFRGTADAGEVVKDGVDTRTGLPIISLYGKNKKPHAEQLKELDLVIFDIQDVGARFYTYISSLHYVMEACAEQNIPVLILDRPNPNGHYIDGPILEMAHKSFVGMHPIPVVHGMTIGEYAKMINGEKWLENGIQCDLNIIPVEHYTHQTPYSLPIKPSPNLPNDASINLYPSLCFFEGTDISIGRGTDKQFQVVGSPLFKSNNFPFEFTPKSNEGAKYPKHENKTCYGYDLSKHEALNGLNLTWLKEFYIASTNSTPEKSFFTDFFTLLAGTKKLQEQIEAGWAENDIKLTWKEGLKKYDNMRQPYLLYK